MRLIIISDAFPPMRTSAAVHMHELALELIRQGHKVTVIIPVASSEVSFEVDSSNGYRLVLISTLKTKNLSYLRRAIAEFIAPYVMYQRLNSSSIINESFEGIIWLRHPCLDQSLRKPTMWLLEPIA